MRLDAKEEMKAQKGRHHDDVAANSDEITDFINQKEPFVNVSAKGRKMG